MPFRRTIIDLERATVRAPTPDDLTAVSRLLYSARHFMVSYAGEDLPDLIGVTPGALLTNGEAIWAAMITAIPRGNRTWVRTVVIADGIKIDQSLNRLIPQLHRHAQVAQVQQIYYGGDTVSDLWLAPGLRTHTYTQDTYVLSYEKHAMDAPSAGNRDVHIRSVQPEDLAHVLAIDEQCFEPHWAKDALVLRPAIEQAAYCVIAELAGVPVGYAFAMDYHGGLQLHLVRIAVLPELRGQAIGVRLLAEVVAFARRTGVQILTLNTQEYNTNARGLYAWFGFQPTGERQLILRADLG
jgi:ribosomal-protein-alanine N-acetyltransferase